MTYPAIPKNYVERECVRCGGLLKIETKPDRWGRLICTSVRSGCRKARQVAPTEA